MRQLAGADREEECYWVAEESLPALRLAGLPASFQQVSQFAGVFGLEAG